MKILLILAILVYHTMSIGQKSIFNKDVLVQINNNPNGNNRFLFDKNFKTLSMKVNTPGANNEALVTLKTLTEESNNENFGNPTCTYVDSHFWLCCDQTDLNSCQIYTILSFNSATKVLTVVNYNVGGLDAMQQVIFSL